MREKIRCILRGVEGAAPYSWVRFAGGYGIRPYDFVILSERSESKDLGSIVSA